MVSRYSILINTTDSFEDCWFPFFTLFKKFWPEYCGKIYLNTETKVYEHEGLNIISIQNNIGTPHKIVTWSECLLRALDVIDGEIILYMQEDYFLKDFVKNDVFENFVKLISFKTTIDCIHITDSGGNLGLPSIFHDKLNHLISPQRYLTNCQAALWKKSTLHSLIRPYENAWQFEEFGSMRAEKSKPIFLGVNRSFVKHQEYEIIPYIFTGIIEGRWYEPVVELFKIHQIQVDFSVRGFVNQAPKRSLKTKFLYQLKRFPIVIKNRFDLISLK
jgi:hypothetical protein